MEWTYGQPIFISHFKAETPAVHTIQVFAPNETYLYNITVNGIGIRGSAAASNLVLPLLVLEDVHNVTNTSADVELVLGIPPVFGALSRVHFLRSASSSVSARFIPKGAHCIRYQVYSMISTGIMCEIDASNNVGSLNAALGTVRISGTDISLIGSRPIDCIVGYEPIRVSSNRQSISIQNTSFVSCDEHRSRRAVFIDNGGTTQSPIFFTNGSGSSNSFPIDIADNETIDPDISLNLTSIDLIYKSTNTSTAQIANEIDALVFLFNVSLETQSTLTAVARYTNATARVFFYPVYSSTLLNDHHIGDIKMINNTLIGYTDVNGSFTITSFNDLEVLVTDVHVLSNGETFYLWGDDYYITDDGVILGRCPYTINSVIYANYYLGNLIITGRNFQQLSINPCNSRVLILSSSSSSSSSSSKTTFIAVASSLGAVAFIMLLILAATLILWKRRSANIQLKSKKRVRV